MPIPRDRVAAALIESALALHRLSLWNEVTSDQALLVRLDDDAHPVVVMISGQDQRSYGLTVFRGAEALAAARMAMEFPSEGDDELQRESILRMPAGTAQLVLTIDPLAEIPAHGRAVLAAGGFVGRREVLAPCVLVLRPGGRVVAPTRTEMRVLLGVIEALRAARTDRRLDVRSIVLDDELPILRVSRSPADELRVERGIERVSPPWSAPLVVRGDRVRIRATPQSDERWVAGFVDIQVARRAEAMSVFAIVNARDGAHVIAVPASPLSLVEIGDAVVDTLVDMEKGVRPRVRPREITFTHGGLTNWFAPFLDEVQIRSSVGEPSSWFTEHATRAAQLYVHLLESADLGPGPTTMPTTVDEWFDADESVAAAIEHLARDPTRDADEARIEYFGDVDAAEAAFDRFEFEAEEAFAEWRAAEFNERPGAPTLLEEWILQSESEAQRVLLEARRRATIGVWRVVAATLNESIELEDVISGEHTTVLFPDPDGSDQVGRVLPLRLLELPVGVLALAAGPSMSEAAWKSCRTAIDDVVDRDDRTRWVKNPLVLAKLFAILPAFEPE